MGFFDKIKFWKKDDVAIPDFKDLEPLPGGEPGKDFMASQGLGPELGGPEMEGPPTLGPTPAPPPPPPGSPARPPPPTGVITGPKEIIKPTGSPELDKDLQMISLKLDALKSQLESVSVRVENIEKIAKEEAKRAEHEQPW